MTEEQAIRLLNAKNESEVAGLIQDFKDDFDLGWKPLGGIEGNFGAIGSQVPNPEGSLTELLTNSVDAILLKRYREQFGPGFDPDTGLFTYEEAADELLPDPENEEITVAADGGKYDPNITIYDSGHGQPPEKIEDTFVGLLRAGKTKHGWPFLQGQFGMGGGAVFPFSGDRQYKFILTSSNKNPETWGWTLARAHREENQYEYLVIDGMIPSFPGKVNGKSSGSFVKVYNYDLTNTSNVTAQLAPLMEKWLWDIPVPVRFIESRDEIVDSERSLQSTGGFGRYKEFESYIEDRFTFGLDFGDQLGIHQIKCVVFKSDEQIKELFPDKEYPTDPKRRWLLDAKKRHRQRTVFFIVNGQVHAALPEGFIANRCGYKRLAEDTMVFVDLSDIASQSENKWMLSRLFQSSRDRLSGSDLSQKLKDELEEELSGLSELQRLEEVRKQRLFDKKQKQREEKVFTEILDRNPAVRQLMTTGEEIPSQGRVDPDDIYNPPFYPTTLRILEKHTVEEDIVWEGDDLHTKTQAINRNRWVHFELDAPNDYFSRSRSPGDIKIDPGDIPVKSAGLSNGVLSVLLEPLEDVEVGDVIEPTITVTRKHDSPLTENFRIEYTDEEKQKETSSTQVQNPPKEGGVDKPDIREVTEDMWDSFGFDEHSVVEMISKPDDTFEFNVNVDATPIRQFVDHHGISSEKYDMVIDYWKTATVLFSIGQYHMIKKKIKQNGMAPDIDPEELVQLSMRGVGQTMLELVIGDDELDYLKA